MATPAKPDRRVRFREDKPAEPARPVRKAPAKKAAAKKKGRTR